MLDSSLAVVVCASFCDDVWRLARCGFVLVEAVDEAGEPCFENK